jgi:site-specific DNA-cytosine methylase
MARAAPPKAKDPSANLGFEAKLWLTADMLRNNLEAAEYKHVVLNPIFLKYISDTFEEHRAKLFAGQGDYEDARGELIDMSDYEAQQRRQRFFVFATREGLADAAFEAVESRCAVHLSDRGIRCILGAEREPFGLKERSVNVLGGDEAAPTVTTIHYNFVHYSEPRVMTVRECARLQTFPDWFEFKGLYTTDA